MVTKRIRSEYMKKFKDPKWETYSKCYEEQLMYRLARRLLEQSHKPWFWDGSDSDSDSPSSPSPPDKNKVGPLGVRDGPTGQREPPARAPPDQPVPGSEDAAPESRPPIGRPALEARGLGEARRLGEAGEERTRASGQPEHPDQGEEPVASPKPSRKAPKVRGLLRRPRETKKENRHAFALYGCGEQRAETAGRRTHNVGPAASTNQIHESALRAQTRRGVEKQMWAEQADRRRAWSADRDKTTKTTKTRTTPDFDPWVTEYMRCFSARSR